MTITLALLHFFTTLEPMKWLIEYDNDTSHDDEGFSCWWTVTDGTRRFDCKDEDDAKWLAETLNAIPWP